MTKKDTVSYFATILGTIRKRASVKLTFLEESNEDRIETIFQNGQLVNIEGGKYDKPINNLSHVIKWQKGNYLEEQLSLDQEITKNVKINHSSLVGKITQWETQQFVAKRLDKHKYYPRVRTDNLESIFFNLKGKTVEEYSDDEWINIRILTARLEKEQFSGYILIKSDNARGFIVLTRGVVATAYYSDNENRFFHSRALETIFKSNHEIHFEVKLYKMLVHILAPLLAVMTGNKTVDGISNRILDIEKLIHSYSEVQTTCCIWARSKKECSILLIYKGMIAGSMILGKGEIYPSTETFLLTCYDSQAFIEVYEFST